jgi:hypothetical protein
MFEVQLARNKEQYNAANPGTSQLTNIKIVRKKKRERERDSNIIPK